MVLDLFRKNISSREEEQQRQKNAAILDLALLQRSKIHIQFDQTLTNLSGVSGTILALNTNGIILELSGVSSLKDRFIGQPLTCFLKIVERDDRHREIFYNFQSTILRVKNLADKPPQIAVSFPTHLQGAQRRKSLRMKPDLQQFAHIALWKYDSSGGFDIAKPTVGLSHFKSTHASIENLSAGGLRITLRKALLKEQGIAPQKGHRFILFTTFSEIIPKIRHEYWLVCKVNNIQPNPVSGDIILGLEFVANGVRQPESGKVEWSKIEDNVIDDLAQRIYQWHVNLYRNKGISG
ncbi:MAG: pilus assembly protein PilZ [Solidesulfovibrio sp. DCME]|uniref:pilus assembly protein PilZ n=1 Tax=Solidesulfovibrio sp. DCME TaxID=3447380 RepID=UPI003D0D2F69